MFDVVDDIPSSEWELLSSHGSAWDFYTQWFRPLKILVGSFGYWDKEKEKDGQKYTLTLSNNFELVWRDALWSKHYEDVRIKELILRLQMDNVGYR